MHAHDRGALAGTESPTSTLQPGEGAVPQASSLNRVGAFLHAWCERPVSDAELHQHATDCTHLMEVAYARFQAYGDPADREQACLWMHGRDEALRALSPQWKAQREAQIQQSIAEGCGYFIEQGDAARARLEKSRL